MRLPTRQLGRAPAPLVLLARTSAGASASVERETAVVLFSRVPRIGATSGAAHTPIVVSRYAALVRPRSSQFPCSIANVCVRSELEESKAAVREEPAYTQHTCCSATEREMQLANGPRGLAAAKRAGVQVRERAVDVFCAVCCTKRLRMGGRW